MLIPIREALPGGGFGTARLAFFSDCPDLLGYLQAEAADRVTAWGLGGGPYMWGRGGPMIDMAATTVPAVAMDQSTGGMEAPAEAAPASPGSQTYSGTNTQEVGVDEGDIVETNGTHVFVASQDGVRIVDVADADVVDEARRARGHPSTAARRRLACWSPRSRTPASRHHRLAVRRHRSVGDRRCCAAATSKVASSPPARSTARLVWSLTSSLATRLPFVYPDQFGLDEERALAAQQGASSSSRRSRTGCRARSTRATTDRSAR